MKTESETMRPLSGFQRQNPNKKDLHRTFEDSFGILKTESEQKWPLDIHKMCYCSCYELLHNDFEILFLYQLEYESFFSNALCCFYTKIKHKCFSLLLFPTKVKVKVIDFQFIKILCCFRFYDDDVNVRRKKLQDISVYWLYLLRSGVKWEIIDGWPRYIHLIWCSYKMSNYCNLSGVTPEKLHIKNNLNPWNLLRTPNNTNFFNVTVTMAQLQTNIK